MLFFVQDYWNNVETPDGFDYKTLSIKYCRCQKIDISLGEFTNRAN